MTHLSWPIFGTNHYYYFHLLIGPFHCAKFYKNLTADPELWGYIIFGPKMVPPLLKFLFENYWYHSHLPISPFILQNFKNILPADPELWCTIFGPKMAHFPKWKFFQRTYYWALFLSYMTIYMPKIKVRYLSISEILTIKEYWNLIWL